MKILILGSNPSIRSNGNEAFEKNVKSTAVLSSWLTQIPGSPEFMFDNVSSEKTTDNKPLSKSQIEESIASLSNKIKYFQPDRIVALGKTAEAALKMIGVEFLAMPHPSGMNRLLNDKEFVAQKIKDLVAFCTTRSI